MRTVPYEHFAAIYVRNISTLKFASAIFFPIFIFSPNNSSLKIIKNVFYLIEKALFVLDFLEYFPFPQFPNLKGPAEVE